MAQPWCAATATNITTQRPTFVPPCNHVRPVPHLLPCAAIKSPRYEDYAASAPHVEEITSLQNSTGQYLPPPPPLHCRRLSYIFSNPFFFTFAVKHCVKLRTQRGYRAANQSVILSGADLIRELAHVEFLFVFHIKGSPPPPTTATSGARVIAVTEVVMQKITGLESVGPATLAAEVALPDLVDFESWRPGRLHRLLVLERCQDPGNLGTLLRTALGLGWDGVFLLPGCADHFNEKAMRASRGACFKLPIASGSLDDWRRVAGHHELECVAADLDRSSSSSNMNTSKSSSSSDGSSGNNINNEKNSINDVDALSALSDAHISLVLGSEGQGLSEEVLEDCQAVNIPMLGEMESLNVAVAGGILMWALSSGQNALNFEEKRST